MIEAGGGLSLALGMALSSPGQTPEAAPADSLSSVERRQRPRRTQWWTLRTPSPYSSNGRVRRVPYTRTAKRPWPRGYACRAAGPRRPCGGWETLSDARRPESRPAASYGGFRADHGGVRAAWDGAGADGGGTAELMLSGGRGKTSVAADFAHSPDAIGVADCARD